MTILSILLIIISWIIIPFLSYCFPSFKLHLKKMYRYTLFKKLYAFFISYPTVLIPTAFLGAISGYYVGSIYSGNPNKIIVEMISLLFAFLLSILKLIDLIDNLYK